MRGEAPSDGAQAGWQPLQTDGKSVALRPFQLLTPDSKAIQSCFFKPLHLW